MQVVRPLVVTVSSRTYHVLLVTLSVPQSSWANILLHFYKHKFWQFLLLPTKYSVPFDTRSSPATISNITIVAKPIPKFKLNII